MTPKKKPHYRLTKKELMLRRRKMTIAIVAGLFIGGFSFIFNRSFITSGVITLMTFGLVLISFGLMGMLKRSARIKKIETVFPDFLQLVSSNLRAGMTIDKAMLLSSRPEFAPLDKEILQTGKDISTGKPVELALRAMSERIGSATIEKTLLIILSGIRAGGNLAILLEDTSNSMRQRGFVEKKAASQVLMYVIFIFLAVSMFSPGLFSLSGVLVETLTDMMGGISADSVPANMPISFTSISITESFIFWFSISFILMMDIMASMILGLVGKGDEKEGVRYLPIMILLSLGIFFASSRILSAVMGGLMG